MRQIRRLASSARASRPLARRGRRRRRGRRCRPRVPPRVLPVRRRSDCRCGYRYCRRSAVRTARQRDRRRQTQMMSSDRSVSLARPSWDRAWRRRGSTTLQIPDCVRRRPWILRSIVAGRANVPAWDAAAISEAGQPRRQGDIGGNGKLNPFRPFQMADRGAFAARPSLKFERALMTASVN